LRPAGRLALARRLDGTSAIDPEQPEVVWSYRYRDGQLRLARTEGNHVENCIVEYAFGSGHHATTFVNIIDPSIPAILEHRLTYYTQKRALGITPGHIAHPPPPGLTPRGYALSAEVSAQCFDCHSTEISARRDGRIDETTMIPDVSCERCHGPGRAHVEAAQRGATDADLELPFGTDGWTAESLMKLCGACHRHPSDALPGLVRTDHIALARFQPIGIMQSKCYPGSDGAFHCVTCHDPHARASANRPGYDAVCLSCHGNGASPAPPVESSAPRDGRSPTKGSRKPCPVSPGSRCVECHMPRVDAGQSVLFSDHWIRVRESLSH
jgi:hypothetical protein